MINSRKTILNPDGSLPAPCPSTSYLSSLDAVRLAMLVGDPVATQAGLVESLQGRGIDTTPATTGLPSGLDGTKESIARLIALARGNGLAVLLQNFDAVAGRVNFTISQPATLNLLQAGHDAPTNTRCGP